MGPVSSFRENVLRLVTVEVTGVQAHEAVLAGQAWPPAVSIGLGIPGTVSSRTGGHLFAPTAGPHGRWPSGRLLGTWPSLLGLAILGGGAACLEGAVPGPVGSQLHQPQCSFVSGSTEQMKEDGVLRMCVGAAAPTPARTPAPSTLPCLLRPLGDHWWVPAGSVSAESGELGWEL